IVRKYGADAPRVVRDDPYIVAEQIRGIGFRTADRIAEALGIAGDDLRRVQGGVLHLIGKAVDEGHVFATRPQLHDGLEQLDVPSEALEDALTTRCTPRCCIARKSPSPARWPPSRTAPR
ncbi:MAG: hypothetical protein JRF54_02435, partial [Deltaproteobacteria bacterium]|nr:hypothetical protein [Deltaproteobacteria bacterium]